MLLFYTPLARWSPHPERTPSAQRGAEVDAGLCMLSHAESTSSARHHLAWALGLLTQASSCHLPALLPVSWTYPD